LLQISIRNRVGQIAYVQFAGHLLPSVIYGREAREQKTRAHSQVQVKGTIQALRIGVYALSLAKDRGDTYEGGAVLRGSDLRRR